MASTRLNALVQRIIHDFSQRGAQVANSWQSKVIAILTFHQRQIIDQPQIKDVNLMEECFHVELKIPMFQDSLSTIRKATNVVLDILQRIARGNDLLKSNA